ncbi:MAG: diguanylate cyclase [Desulfobulbales bacterium]|nr:diguanylate cyclase [Desulfobulbales bacterium]
MTTEKKDSSPDEERILVVDDDPLILELLGITVRSFGFECVEAGGGREAMDIIAGGDFSIVVTDMMMPGIDGMQLLEHIKSNYPETSVIVVTGYTGTFSYVDVIRAGASDFILKPFNADELEAKINRIMREREMVRNLEFLSNCDPLTGLYNRRYMDKKVKEEVHRAARQDYAAFLILIDVDNFKAYNDNFGHQKGDRLLIRIAEILRHCTRTDVDLVFRHGGDEFAILTPQVNREQVAKVGRRIIASFEGQMSGKIGLSLGATEFVRTGDKLEKDVYAMFSRADQALYRAKENGRNQMVFSD